MKQTIYGATYLAMALMATCGNVVNATATETDNAFNFQGLWPTISMDTEDYLLITDKYVRFYEDMAEDSGFMGSITNKTPTSLEFTAKGKNGKITLEDNCINIMWGDDFETQGFLDSFYNAVTSTSDKNNAIYADPEMKTKSGNITLGEALPIITIGTESMLVKLPEGRVGYVCSDEFIRADISDDALNKSYEAADGGWSTSYSFTKKGDKVAVSKDMMRLDGMGAGGSQYFGGSIKGNAIVVDSETYDYSSFEDQDFSKFEKLETPFTIYVVEGTTPTRLIIDNKVYNIQEF